MPDGTANREVWAMALITYLTKIQFDFGARDLLAAELAALGVIRPLLVTDKGIVEAGIVDMVREALPPAMTVVVFDKTPANPTEQATRAALEVYRTERLDGIIAVGGGSALDLAKGVRLLATHDGTLAQYALIEGGLARIRADVAPMIAMPTTAGTGSEVGRGAVIIVEDGRKLGIISPHLIPNVAICDPELTMGMPPGLTAGTGMDALAHCIETYLSPQINPPAEAIALDGMRRASRHVERAVADGTDHEARWQMMMAAMEGAMAFQKGLGAVHAMSHPLGGLPGLSLHHGTLNAVVMPAVLNFNRDHVGEKYAAINQAMGQPADADPAVIVADLNARLRLPTGLREMGVSEDVLPEIAAQAERDHCNATNPRPANATDYLALLKAAMG